MKKVIIGLVAVVIVAIIFFAGYRYLYKKSDNLFKLSGELQISQVDLAFKVSGSISSKYFHEGMAVKKGDLLGELDNETYVAQAKIAKSQEDVAYWELEEVKANFKKYGVSDSNIIEKTKSGLDIATANRELADYQLSYTKLYSPIDGIVLSSYKEVGEMVSAGMPVFSIGDVSKIYLRAYLPASKLSAIKIGQKMDIKVDGLPNDIFEGTVSFISDEAEFTPKHIYTADERVKLVYKVKIDITDGKNLLKSGIPADAYLKE